MSIYGISGWLILILHGCGVWMNYGYAVFSESSASVMMRGGASRTGIILVLDRGVWGNCDTHIIGRIEHLSIDREHKPCYFDFDQDTPILSSHIGRSVQCPSKYTVVKDTISCEVSQCEVDYEHI